MLNTIMKDFCKTLIPIGYFEKDIEFAKHVIRFYEDKREANASWFGPKIPFCITMPKLMDNAITAKKVIIKQHGGKRKGSGRPKKEKTVVMRIPKSKVKEVKELIK